MRDSSQSDSESVIERDISPYTTIRIHRDTHQSLKNLKPEALTYDELITELVHEFESVEYDIRFEHSDS